MYTTSNNLSNNLIFSRGYKLFVESVPLFGIYITEITFLIQTNKVVTHSSYTVVNETYSLLFLLFQIERKFKN